MTELMPLRGKNPFDPRPSNEVLVFLGCFWKICDEHPVIFIKEFPPWLTVS